MKKILLLFLLPLALFGAAGDIKVSYKAPNNIAWIDAIFAKQNSSLLGTDSSGVPRIATDATLTGLLSINQATASNPTVPTGTLLHITGPDATSAYQVVDSFGIGAPIFLGRRAAGTSAAPSAVTSGLSLAILWGSGYNGSAYTSAPGGIAVTSTQTWTPSANGTRIDFYTIPNGSTTSALAFSVDQDKSATVAGDLIVTNGLFRCTSDVVSTSTGLADITGLTGFTVVSGKTYSVRLVLFMQASSTGGWNIKINGTATVSALYGMGTITHAIGAASTVDSSTLSALNAGPNFAGASGGAYAVVDFTFTASGNGTIIPQFSQNNATGNSTVKAGSYMWTQRF